MQYNRFLYSITYQFCQKWKNDKFRHLFTQKNRSDVAMKERTMKSRQAGKGQ